MLRHGMDRQLLASTSEEELKDECGVKNGIHRRIIMQHLSGMFFFYLHICLIFWKAIKSIRLISSNLGVLKMTEIVKVGKLLIL